MENKVFNEDIMQTMKKIPDEYIDMIYSDPDYNVGIKYNNKSYTKNFKQYIDWYISLAHESLRILKDDGNAFFINYPKQNAFLWANYLEKNCNDVVEYVWVYNTNVGHSPKKFTRAHRSILHCRKTKNNKWYKNQVAEPYKNPQDKRILRNIANGSKGRMPYSWMYYDLVKNVSKDKTFHSCQIPISLFEKLMYASTQTSDIILVHFGGSGNEIISAKNHNRKYLAAEIDEKYYNMIIERLKNGGIIPEKYKLKLNSNKNIEKNVQNELFSL